MDPTQFRLHVVRPALTYIGLHSEAAEYLVTGTAVAESGLRYLVQHGDGPARGVFQVEPKTEQDVWVNYLQYRTRLSDLVTGLMLTAESLDNLTVNPMYGAAIARLVYRRSPLPLPDHRDPDATGAYWKEVYNTHLGKGDPAKFAFLYRKHVLGDS